MCVGMWVSVAADAAAAAYNDDRYNHQQSKDTDTQTESQPEPVNENEIMRTRHIQCIYYIYITVYTGVCTQLIPGSPYAAPATTLVLV